MKTRPWWILIIAGIGMVLIPGLALGAQDRMAAVPGMVPAGKWQVGLSTIWQATERFQDTAEFANFNNQDFGSEASTGLKLRDDRFHLATLAYGLHRCLTLMVRAGMAEGGTLSENLSNGQWDAKLNPVFVWSLGARSLLWEHPNGLGFTAGMAYLRYDNRGIDKWWYVPEGSDTAQWC